MIEIKIKPDQSFFNCPDCKIKGIHKKYIFQGIHSSEKFSCSKCNQEYIFDLPIGHSFDYDFKYNLSTNTIKTKVDGAFSWFSKPYKNALDNPNFKKIKVEKITNKKVKKPLIINCIDYLYGHGLLKLFNIERHLKNHAQYDLVVIIPKSLLWLVPKQVAQIILVDIKLSQARNYYPSLDKQINKYILKFKSVGLSKAYAHPNIHDISYYTQQKSCIKLKKPRITFIWRSDRPWFNNIYIVYLLKKIELISIINFLQYLKINLLFSLLYIKNKNFIYTIAGFGKEYTFPRWIEDKRTNTFSKKSEKKMSKIYAESKLTIGVHGSNMLLPSAHSQMTLDLMPDDRLGNFAQDIIYELKRNSDFRVTAFNYRYAYLNTSIITIYKTIISMIKYQNSTQKIFTSSKNKGIN